MNLRNVFIFVTIILLAFLLATPAIALFTGHLSGDQYLTSLELILNTLTEVYKEYAS